MTPRGRGQALKLVCVIYARQTSERKWLRRNSKKGGSAGQQVRKHGTQGGKDEVNNDEPYRCTAVGPRMEGDEMSGS